jgi:hypothetical protein
LFLPLQLDFDTFSRAVAHQQRDSTASLILLAAACELPAEQC